MNKMNRLKQTIGAGALVLGLAMATPLAAWESVSEMNTTVDETNFIVGRGCSGTLISTEYRLIVTAYHCVSSNIRTVTKDVVGKDGKIEKEQFEKRKRMTVQQKDYDEFDQVGSLSYETEIVAYYKERDLALLQLVGTKLRSTQSANVLPKGVKVLRGERVVAVGNPRMMDASITAGIVSSTTRKFAIFPSEEAPYIQFDANIQPGSSGGALFNDKGQYIGTTVAAFPGSDLSLAIPVYELHTMLDKACFASIYDPDADDELCRNPVEDEGDDD